MTQSDEDDVNAVYYEGCVLCWLGLVKRTMKIEYNTMALRLGNWWHTFRLLQYLKSSQKYL